MGIGALGALSVVGYLAGAPASEPATPAAKAKSRRGGSNFEFDDGESDDPRVDERIMKAHRRAIEARQSKAGNWATIAGEATAEAIKLMEKSPRYRNSLQMAEVHFIRFEIYSMQGEAFASMAEFHLDSARKALENAEHPTEHSATHKQMLSLVYSNLSEYYNQLGQALKSELYGEKALKLLETEIFKDDPGNINLAITKTSLAMCKSTLKKYSEAEALFKSAYQIFRKSKIAADEVPLIQCITRLGNVLLIEGKHEEAAQMLLPHYNELRSTGSNQRAMGIIYCLARLFYDQAKFVDARPLFENALNLSLGTSLEPIVRTSLQSMLWEMGDVEAAQRENELMRSSKFVAFAESRCLVTREASLDGSKRQYTFEVEIKIAEGYYLHGKRKLEAGNVLVFSFESPNKDDKPVEVEHVIQADQTMIRVDSPVIEGDAPFQAGQYYQGVVHAYTDATKETKIGSHHQLFAEKTGTQKSSRGGE